MLYKSLKISGFLLVMVAMLSFTGLAISAEPESHEHGKQEQGKMEMKMESKAEGKTTTVTGEVIDIACYANHDAKGKEHATCAEQCIKGGQPVGILDAKGSVYIVLGENHKAPSEIGKGLAAKQVKATGKLIEKGGNKYLVVSKLEEVKSGS